MTTVRHVRMTVDLRFEGDYWLTSELVDVASYWIRSALDDRDDLAEVSIDGAVLPVCHHCGDPITGPFGVVPDVAKMAIYHRMRTPRYDPCHQAYEQARARHAKGARL